MKIVYDSRVDGMSITFSEDKPNRTVNVTSQVTLYLHNERLVLMDVRQASSLMDDPMQLISQYVPKGAPFNTYLEVDRDGDG